MSSETNKETDSLKYVVAVNANARSLCPKIESLADCMHEIDADLAVVTETWLQDRSVNDSAIDLAGQHGLDLFTLNRRNIAANGRQYGGVAVTTRSARTSFKVLELPNPENFEVLCVTGKIRGIGEKVVVIAVYIPPNYPRHRADSCLDYVADVVSEAKRQFASAMIIVAGDWNQWPTDHVLQEHPDMVEVEHGPTRNDRKIDKFLVNFGRSVIESDILPPLDDGMGRESDHLISYLKAAVKKPRQASTTYSYRHYTEEGAARFQDWIASADFGPVLACPDPNEQLNLFLGELESASNACFSLKTTTRRESDPPWINSQVRSLARKRRRIYRREGRSHQWKALMKKTRQLVRKRAAKYWEHQKSTMLQGDANRSFFKNIKAYKSREKPPNFDVRTLFQSSLTDGQIAEKLADHFNGISSEFDGLDPSDIPVTYSAPLVPLTVDQVTARLKTIRKPKSMVKHDIFPCLVSGAAAAIAIPLTAIYNNMLATRTWPLRWKEEFVTPIPKKPVPANVNDLRNISCTALFSKVFESFVLDRLTEQVGMRGNQMGGMRGAGAEHYLVQLWQSVLEALEDPRAASVLTSIDYAKAFNRLDFRHCLRALADKGASTELIAVIASFLTSRTMAVKVGQVLSAPRVVLGGVPQGSILGVFLFNATIDSFEAASNDVARYNTVRGPEPLSVPAHDRSLDVQVDKPYDRPGFRAWVDSLLEVLKYVDDNIIIEKICLDNLVIDADGRKVGHAARTQNLFRQIVRVAELKGMKVNALKTLLMCVSDSRTYEAGAFIIDREGVTIESCKAMKILGLHFTSKPDVSAQVEAICRKFRGRIWYLRHLHHNGFSQPELLRVYKSTILPCHDYCSSVFNSSLTLSQSIKLERLQAKALKAIYGYEPSYRELMERSELSTLRARRDERELRFAQKCAASTRFAGWFPLKPPGITRGSGPYVEEYARCCRFYNSPIFSMRRRLNKEIRTNGAREGGAAEPLRTARA